MVLLRVAVFLAALSRSCAGVQMYGHAYQAPGDFTPTQYQQIARSFPIFTVEKRHAYGIYGDQHAPAGSPFRYNSIRAAVQTAAKIKAINRTSKVLMYWNSDLHFNMYECEAQVQPSWLIPPTTGPKQPQYNYSVPEFRKWWVDCAAGAVLNSTGVLDGLFLDAVPKVDIRQDALKLWGSMVDQLRARLGAAAVLIYNGFYMSSAKKLAGVSAWSHTGVVYVDSLAGLGSGELTLGQSVQFLEWLSQASQAHPARVMVGHGSASCTDNKQFVFDLAAYLLVCPGSASAYFLNNQGYSVDQGLLCPHSEYGAPLGSPLRPMTRVSKWVFEREFAHGNVSLDLSNRTGHIQLA